MRSFGLPLILFAATALGQVSGQDRSFVLPSWPTPSPQGPTSTYGFCCNSSNLTPHDERASDIRGKAVPRFLEKSPDSAWVIRHMTGHPAGEACAGMKSLADCLITAHVSHDLGIDFDCLKAAVTGRNTTNRACDAKLGPKKMKLTEAIQALQPSADAKVAANEATVEARLDIAPMRLK